MQPSSQTSHFLQLPSDYPLSKIPSAFIADHRVQLQRLDDRACITAMLGLHLQGIALATDRTTVSRPRRAAHCTRMRMPIPLVHALVWDARDADDGAIRSAMLVIRFSITAIYGDCKNKHFGVLCTAIYSTSMQLKIMTPRGGLGGGVKTIKLRPPTKL